jgi:hypothetical protein
MLTANQEPGAAPHWLTFRQSKLPKNENSVSARQSATATNESDPHCFIIGGSELLWKSAIKHLEYYVFQQNR